MIPNQAAVPVPPKFPAIADPELSPAMQRFLLFGRLPVPTRIAAAVIGSIGFLVLAVLMATTTVPVAITTMAVLTAATVLGPLQYDRLRARHVVDGRQPRFRGVDIVDQGLDLLVDISHRFEWARRNIDELPDLVQWRDIENHVNAIRWDAAEHAAALTATDADWQSVRNAPATGPQAVFKRRIEQERQDHVTILEGYQVTADRLMNRAADAVAAAKVAERAGYDLEIVVPSARGSAARAELEAVIERLDALTAAWKALDESTDLLADDLTTAAATEREAALRRAQELRAAIEGPTSAAAPGTNDRETGSKPSSAAPDGHAAD